MNKTINYHSFYHTLNHTNLEKQIFQSVSVNVLPPVTKFEIFLEQGKKCGGVREKCVIKFDDVSVVKSKFETIIEIMEENGLQIHDG